MKIGEKEYDNVTIVDADNGVLAVISDENIIEQDGVCVLFDVGIEKDGVNVVQDSDILSSLYTKLVIANTKNEKELVVITSGDTPINIFDDDIIVKLTPRYD